MNIADIIVIALITVAIVGAVIVIRKNKKNGKYCNGDCSSCNKCK